MARKKKITGMNLSPIWWIETPIDYEHKQYVFLDYLQKVEKGLRTNNLADYLSELRYHSKNIECFLTIRSMLELRDIPAPTEEQREYFKKITGVPDDNKDLIEAIRICKWAKKQMEGALKQGTEVFKKIESSLNLYFIGKQIDKNTGYLLLRYAGSPVFECYKFIHDPVFKDTSFILYKYYDMNSLSDFADVKMKILEEDNKSDDMFIAVESILSYDTKKTIFPVLNQLFAARIFTKNSFGLKY